MLTIGYTLLKMQKSIKICPKNICNISRKTLKKTLAKHLQWSTLFSKVGCPYLQVYKKQSFIEYFSREFCKNVQLIAVYQNTCGQLLLLPYATKPCFFVFVITLVLFDKMHRKMRIWSQLLNKSLMENVIFYSACAAYYNFNTVFQLIIYARTFTLSYEKIGRILCDFL